MAYFPPELEEIGSLKSSQSAADKEPLDISRETDGTVLVKFFFLNCGSIPKGIPKRADRPSFPTTGKTGQKRKDTGVCVIDRAGVSARLLRTGLANADGHTWKIVDVSWWEQEITNRQAAKDIGDRKQCVVQLVYRANPDPDRDPIRLTREIVDAVRVLANDLSWTTRVWFNQGGPATINFTSPQDEEPKALLVVRDGCLQTVKVEASTVAA